MPIIEDDDAFRRQFTGVESRSGSADYPDPFHVMHNLFDDPTLDEPAYQIVVISNTHGSITLRGAVAWSGDRSWHLPDLPPGHEWSSDTGEVVPIRQHHPMVVIPLEGEADGT